MSALVFGDAGAAVDHLHRADEDNHRTQDDDAADHEDVGIGRGRTGFGAEQRAAAHRAIGHELAEDRDTDRTGDGLHQIVEAQCTSGFLGLHGQRCGIHNRLVEERGAEVVDARRHGKSPDLAHRNQERNGDQATAHAGERQNDGGLAADLLDNRASGEAHDGGEDDRPHQQVGDLGGVDAVHVQADGVAAGVQGVAEEVADKDDDHGHREGRVGEHLRGDERIRGLVDVDHEGHAGDQHRDTPEDSHVGEEHGHRAGEQANECEADHVDARALGMLVRQVLGQDRDEEHRDDADTEEDAPIDKGRCDRLYDRQSVQPVLPPPQIHHHGG